LLSLVDAYRVRVGVPHDPSLLQPQITPFHTAAGGREHVCPRLGTAGRNLNSQPDATTVEKGL